MANDELSTIGIGSQIPGYAGGWNPKRNCKLWLGKYSERKSAQSDWHSSACNTLGTREHPVSVNPSVPLVLESDTLSISYENNYTSGNEALPENAKGLFDKASNFLEQVSYLTEGTSFGRGSAVKRASKFDAPQVWESTSPLKLDGDLTFSFKFGCGGLFNAYEEVVKPILVLASIFAPKELSGTNSNGVTENWIEPPLPTMGEWGARFLSSAIRSIVDDGKNQLSSLRDKFSESEPPAEPARPDPSAPPGSYTRQMAEDQDRANREAHNKSLQAQDNSFFDNAVNSVQNAGKIGEAASDVFNKAIEIRNNLFDAIHSGAAQVLEESGYPVTGTNNPKNTFAIGYLKTGNFLLGPFTVSNVSINFDNKLLDENGYPSAGTITLSGITYYATATDREIWNVVQR